jgi:hypothetical protein
VSEKSCFQRSKALDRRLPACNERDSANIFLAEARSAAQDFVRFSCSLVFFVVKRKNLKPRNHTKIHEQSGADPNSGLSFSPLLRAGFRKEDQSAHPIPRVVLTMRTPPLATSNELPTTCHERTRNGAAAALCRQLTQAVLPSPC